MDKELNTFGNFIQTFGFPILFGVVVIIILVWYFRAKIKTMNDNASMEKEKTLTELDLMKKQRLQEMDRNDKITGLVIDVQTKQVDQLNKMNDNMDDLSKMITSTYLEMKSVHADIDNVYTIVTKIQKDTGETLTVVKESNQIVKKMINTSNIDKGDE